MSLWIASRTNLGGHKKLYALCKELKIDAPTAVGHLHYLWWWTILNRSEEGDLIGLFPKDIAQAAKYEKEPKRFLEALKKCGWIDRDMKIHDWQSHAGPLLKSRERKKRWNNAHGTEKERSWNENGTFQESLNSTVPYSTVQKELKTGLFSQKEEEIIKNDISEHRKIAPNSEAATQRLNEIVSEIAKIKDVKKPFAMARYKAQNQ